MSKGAIVRTEKGVMVCKLSPKVATAIIGEACNSGSVQRVKDKKYAFTSDMVARTESMDLFFWEGYTITFPT